MTSWNDFARCEPDLAARVRAILDAHTVKVLATLRADGSPRVSGIEVAFTDEDLTFGSMPGAVKGADLRRDPRFAVHSVPVEALGDEAQRSSTGDGGETGTPPGDVKVSGRAVATGALTGEQPGDGFRADLTEVVWVGLNEARDRLVVESWHPGRGRRRLERA